MRGLAATARSLAALTTVALLATLAACSEPTPPPAPTFQPLKMATPPNTPPGSPVSQVTCADNWLGRHGLNELGDAPGTLYPGGTPLFNERTGERVPRLDYLFAHRPELRAECGPGNGKPAPGAVPAR